MQKKILIQSATFFVSKLIPAIFMTLINVIFSRKLTYAEYGAYQGVWSFINISIIFTAFGLPKYILTFGAKITNEAIKKAFAYSFLILLIVLIPISAYLFSGINYFDQSTRILCLLLLLSQTVYLVQEAFAISNHSINYLIGINTTYALLLFFIHLIVIYAFNYQLHYCVLGITLVSVFRNLLILKYIPIAYTKIKATTTAALNYVSQLLWFGINDSLQVVTKWMDKLILLFLLPAADYAIYFNGTFELPLIGMALMAFQTVITAFSSRQADNDGELLHTFSTSAIFMSALLFPLFSWLFLYASPIITILFSKAYSASATLFALSTLLLPMRICSYTVLLQIKGKGKLILTGSILDFVLSLLLMIALYPIYQLNGLVIALVIATYIQAGYYLYHTGKEYAIPFYKLLPITKLFTRFLITFLSLFLLKKILQPLPLTYNCLLGGLGAGISCVFFLNQSLPLIKLKQFLTPFMRKNKGEN